MRTGVAISDPGRVLASPLEVIETQALPAYLEDLVRREDVRDIVVGMPKTLGGEVGFQARRVLDRLETLRRELPGVRFIEWDERLTTRLAAAPGGKKRRRGRRLDHLAAARMLQEYLDARGES